MVPPQFFTVVPLYVNKPERAIRVSITVPRIEKIITSFISDDSVPLTEK